MLEIRQENKNDYEQIYNTIKIAFETAEYSDGNEQDLVVALRSIIQSLVIFQQVNMEY